MFRGYVALFQAQNLRRGGSLLGLVVSDYLAYYEKYNPRDDSTRRLALLFLPRLAHNPCLRAALFLRLALASPRLLHGFWRGFLVTRYSIDVQPAIRIGPGFTMPHPFGIVFGWGVEVGTNVSILHDVTLGSRLRADEGETRLCPAIEDDVTIFTGSILSGPITIGRGAVIGAGSWVEEDVAPGAVHRGVGAELHRLRARLGSSEDAGT